MPYAYIIEVLVLKLKNLSLNFDLMLTKTSLIVFIIFVGQLGYIVMSDSRKNRNIYLLKKKKIQAFFWSRKVKKRKKHTFRTNRYL